MKTQITDPSKAIDKVTYEKLLAFFTMSSMGALFDQEMGNFCILGADQQGLVYSTNHTLRKPLAVMGLGGTGKTICVCARIQYMYLRNKLGPNAKALYVHFKSPNIRKLVENKLKACGVNMNYVEFKDYEDINNGLYDVF